MSVILAIILFIIFILVYMIIAEIFVTLFRITGMPEEIARFQVISMLTNSGYTTKEAEVMVNSKRRRKLTKFVMLFGYAFTVTIVSTLVNIFLQSKNNGSIIALIPIILTILILIFFVKRTKYIQKYINKIISFIANKFLYHKNINPIIIIEDLEEFVIARIIVKVVPKEIKDTSLINSPLKSKYNINLLYIKTNTSSVIPTANTIIKKDDLIVVLGKKENILKLFNI